MMTTTLTKNDATPTMKFVVGQNKPVHVHTCSDGHKWLCSSPYCENLDEDCPDHGGEKPIAIGREPWRGR